MDMVKLKRIKSKSPYLEQEIRNIGALLEHTDDRVTAIAEQYGEIKKTLDQHTSILDHHTDILDQHTSILDHHTDILDQHTSKFDSHEGMIGGIATDLKIVKEDASSIKNSLKKKVDIDDFTPIVRRLTHLEKQVR